MYKDILTKNQRELLSLISTFSKNFYLVGGTAIALYLGHRQSIDFDLFTSSDIKSRSIKTTIEKNRFSIQKVLYEDSIQLHLIVNSVKLTFYSYPYNIVAENDFDTIIKMPTLLDLAAMKAFALGRRAKWKDYVDLYFILKQRFTLDEISDRATQLFSKFFNKKQFCEQLSYFEDIDYTEDIVLTRKKIKMNQIKTFLVNISTASF